MSTQILELKGIEGKMYLTQFFGGKKNGLSLQFTAVNHNETGDSGSLDSRYVQFTKPQVQQLVKELQNWLGEVELPWDRGTRKQQKERAAALGLSDDEAIDFGVMSDEVERPAIETVWSNHK